MHKFSVLSASRWPEPGHHPKVLHCRIILIFCVLPCIQTQSVSYELSDLMTKHDCFLMVRSINRQGRKIRAHQAITVAAWFSQRPGPLHLQSDLKKKKKTGVKVTCWKMLSKQVPTRWHHPTKLTHQESSLKRYNSFEFIIRDLIRKNKNTFFHLFTLNMRN